MDENLVPLVKLARITKRFPGVVALDAVDCQIYRGECVAIVGENGAGKSTLMKIVAGVYQPDSGELYFENKPAHFPTPLSAINSGISLIHQELNLAENLSVADNLFLGREQSYFSVLKILNRSAMQSAGKQLLERVGLPAKYIQYTVGSLAPGEKQLVEIARALGLDSKLIIMDEPTSSLTQKESDRLAIVIDDLKRQNISVLYISHRLSEIKRSADRAVILRDGKNAGELQKEEITHSNLIKKMIGRELKQQFPKSDRSQNQIKPEQMPVFSMRDLRYDKGPVDAVSFDVMPGEVLGMAGLVGSGRTELSEAVFGLRKIIAGEIKLEGRKIELGTPALAIQHGIALVPEDRRLHGLILEASVGFNISLPNLDTLSLLSVVQSSQEKMLTEKSITSLNIRTPSGRQIAGLLSGGNQQKIVFAKWLARKPKLLILDEPTRGVDVGAKAEIYRLIDELAGQGLAVWMITSDMEELLGVSDRVVVMHEGKITGQLSRAELSEQAVMNLATGSGKALRSDPD